MAGQAEHKSYSIPDGNKELLDNFANGVAIFHGTEWAEMTPLICNGKLSELLAIEPESFYSHMSVKNSYAIHPDDLGQARETLLKVIESGSSVRQVFRLLTGRGDYRYTTVFSNVHRLEDGSFDLYCIFSDAEEAEQLHRIRELRRRLSQKKLIQATEKNEAYVLLNLTRDICIERYTTHNPGYMPSDIQTVTEIFAEITNDIAIEEYRREFLTCFSVEAFNSDVREGVVSKEMRIPFSREGRSARWFLLKSELSFDTADGDVEIFMTFTDIDNEIRLEYAMDRLMDNEFEFICQIDVLSGYIKRIGKTEDDDLLESDDETTRYEDVLSFAMENLLPDEYRETGNIVLSMENILCELKKKKVFYTVLPVAPRNGKGDRLCQWSCEYLDESHDTILMCRKNISLYLDYGYDSLTGMLGRKGFYRKVRKELDKNIDSKYFIAIIDFDNFSLVNEENGYAEGNRFIRQFGEDARKRVKSKDKDCYISHFEGDRFAIFSSLDYHNKPEELYDDFVAQVRAYPVGFRLKLRMGIYVIKDKSLDVELMCDCAHIALRAGKGRFDWSINYYSDCLKDRIIDEQLLAAEMQEAIDTEQFEVWFQPQINHSDKGSLIGAEALVRWNHPTRGMVSPAAFIPLFEKNGFIYELDKYVWRHTCKCIREWLDEGLKPLPVSVNVSRLDILNNDFLDTIVAIVKDYDVPYELLHIEVTESAFTDNTGKVMKVVKKLIDIGFIVAIDDFGSGYSSLSMLKSVPAQVLKLDMRFFADDENITRNECIIESIVRMAKMLGMSVLAEGVERMEQANMLWTVGCDYIQGYLYSKPLPYEDYIKYVDHTNGNSIRKIDWSATADDMAIAKAGNQEMYRNIISGTNDIIIVADVATKQLLYANRAAEQYYGSGFDPLKMITCSEYCGNPQACKNCPVQYLKPDEKVEQVIENRGKYMNTVYTRMEWNSHDAFVLCQTDIHTKVQADKSKQKIKDIFITQEKVNSGLREALLQTSSDASIEYILGFIGKVIGSERAYIFEKNPDGTDSNTFEWVAEGVTPEKDNLQNIPEDVSRPWYEAFRNQGVVVIERLEDIRLIYPKLYEALVSQDVQSLIVAPFFDNYGEPVGFFGLDNPSKDELLNYPALAQTIAFFIEASIKRRNLEMQIQGY